jgi:hypothetical protein
MARKGISTLHSSIGQPIGEEGADGRCNDPPGCDPGKESSLPPGEVGIEGAGHDTQGTHDEHQGHHNDYALDSEGYDIIESDVCRQEHEEETNEEDGQLLFEFLQVSEGRDG